MVLQIDMNVYLPIYQSESNLTQKRILADSSNFTLCIRYHLEGVVSKSNSIICQGFGQNRPNESAILLKSSLLAFSLKP